MRSSEGSSERSSEGHQRVISGDRTSLSRSIMVRSSWRHISSPMPRHILGYLLYSRLTWSIAARSVGSKEANVGARRT